jgi:hypothetical protein
MVVHVDNLSYAASIGRRIKVQAQTPRPYPRQKLKTLSKKKTKAKKDWEVWLKW